MGFDNDCILNISSLAGEYFCPVCHLLVYPNEALQAPCTHLYCKPCLTYVVSTTHACPYDGYRVTEADCKPLLESNKSLAETIGKIQVHCLYYRTGCTWQGPLTDCTSHYSTCSYGESPVLCNRCGVQIVHRQVQEHAQNCPGVQSQTQQPSTAQDSTAISAADQSQTVSASQAQTTQASVPLVSGQDANQAANSGAQPQAAQATMPTAEQWYQQQQQYQQYYQQYPGYDPYQQNYQYYYQYQQGVQPYAQQPMQGYPPQAYGQAQPQVSGQAQTQSQVQGQQQVQPHAQPQPQQQPQAPSQTAQPLLQPNAKPAANAQPQAQPVNQGQSQVQAQGQVPPSHALPYNQSQPLPQAQPYGPQPQQQVQVPQYQQTHPQVQHPNAQTYPPSQTQTQHYPYPQPQSQVQPQPQPQPQAHSQPTMQAPARPTSQQNQPMNPSAQLQTHNPVTGYQSYPQPHPQAQVGAPHPMHVPGAQPQPQYPTQVQGKFPSQPSQMYPPQPYSNVANQQQPTMSAAQGQPPSGPPAQQVPVYPHAQQPGYPFQHRTGAVQQAAPQNYGQQQSFPGHGPFTPPQPTMPGQLHAHPQTLQQPQQNYAPAYGAQPNIPQNYPARPVAAQAAGHQPYAQGAGYSGTGQARPPLQNQGYPSRPENHLSAASEQQASFPQQTSRATGGDKSRDQMLDKSLHDQKDPNKEVRDLAGAGVQVNDIKSENSLDVTVNGNESRVPSTHDVQEHKSRTKGDVSEGVSEPSPGSNAAKNGTDANKDSRKKAEVQDLKHTANSTAGAVGPASNMPPSHSGPQAHGMNSFPSVDQGRNQPQPMHYGHSGQHRPGAVPMSQPPHHSYNSQQPALGHPPGQLRPQGPGQIPPRPPFNAAENSQPPISKHHPGAIPHENASGASLGPGSSAPFARPGNLGYHQRPPFASQRPGEFDSHVGMEGRERADVEQRPPYPMESEKYQAQRPGYFDGRKPESLSHGMERVPYGPAHQPGAMRFGGPSAHDGVSGMRDERVKSFHEENMKPFPHRDFEDDLRKFPRSSHLDAGPSSKYGPQFPSSGPLDHGPQLFGGDGMLRPFDKSHHGFDRDGSKLDAGSGPSRFLPPFHPNDAGERGRGTGYPDDNIRRDGFGRSRMDGMPPRSPGSDFSGFPPRTFGAYGDGGNERRPFDGSRPHDFPAEPFGKSNHENRFPVPPNHLQRGEHDVPANMRMGEHMVGGPRNQDMLPSHLRRGEHMGPRNLHMGEATPFGPPGGFHRMGEPPLAGNFPQHLPFGESFGGEKPLHPLAGEPGYRGGPGFQRFAREGGFYPEEMEPFDNPRKRKPGSIMCRICKVECGSVDGLDLHSQSREHQKKARDMVLSIKQQNKKKQKMSKGQAFVEGRDGGRPKNSSFQGRGNKR